MSNKFMEAALEYADRGWKVIPLKPGAKTPLIKGWTSECSSNHDKIRQWWKDTPNANVGIVTGKESNLFVIDVDDKHDSAGSKSLALIEQVAGDLLTLRSRTQSGGMHLFFEYPHNAGKTAVGLLQGIDSRGKGGYVAAPPSVVEERSYSWLNEEKPALLPQSVAALLKHGEKLLPPLDIKEGQRNDTVFRYGCSLLDFKLDEGIADYFMRRAGELCDPPMDYAEVRELMQSVGKRTPNKQPMELTYQRASEIETRDVRWLWDRKFARGKLSLLAGVPGKGKSQATISMAATVSTGGAWPGGDGFAEVGNVILLSSEDDAADTIVPRLEAAGADLSRIFILNSLAIGPKGARTFNLKDDLEALERIISEIGGAALLIIDPITAYLGNVDSHKNADVRAVLAPLIDFAAQHEIAVIGISHLTKDENGEAIFRVSGSGAFVAVARCCYLIGDDPKDEERRIMAPIKNNLGVDNIGYAFKIESRESLQGHATSVVVWEANSFKIHANDLLVPQDRKQRQIDQAMEFLQGVLREGPVEQSRVEYLAQLANLSWRTVLRAKKELQVESIKGKGKKNERGWTWKLPQEAGHLGQDGQQSELALVEVDAVEHKAEH